MLKTTGSFIPKIDFNRLFRGETSVGGKIFEQV